MALTTLFFTCVHPGVPLCWTCNNTARLYKSCMSKKSQSVFVITTLASASLSLLLQGFVSLFKTDKHLRLFLSFILVRKRWRDTTAHGIGTRHDISAYALIILPHLCFIMELDWDTNPHNSSSLSVYCNAGVSIASFQISWVIYKKEQLRRCCWNITPQGGEFHLVSITLMG